MPSYRYLLCDLLTDQLLGDLPLTGVSFDRRLCRTGSFTGSLTASNREQVQLAKMVHAYAGRAALWAYRGSELWWGGVLWAAPAAQGPRGGVSMDLSAATFDSYAWHRRLYADKTYTATDQGIIIPDLWRTLQSDPRGNIGMVALDQPTGVLRDRTYLASEHTKVGQLIEDLGDVIDGPEHTIDTYLDESGNRIKRLRVGQHLGVTDARMVFQRAARGGGRVVEWSHVADAVDGGTTFQVRGDAPNNVGEDSEPLLSVRADRGDLLDAGWPLLDVTEDRPGVSDQATLDGYAGALAEQNGGAMRTSGYTVEVGNTGWSPNRLGDAVRLKLADLWHENTTDLTVRPVGCKVTPPEKGKSEQVELLLADESED